MLSAGPSVSAVFSEKYSKKFYPVRSIDEARETYERLVEIFPTCGRYWKLYIEQEVTVLSNISFIIGNIKLTLGLAFMKSEYMIVPLSYHCFISFTD